MKSLPKILKHKNFLIDNPRVIKFDNQVLSFPRTIKDEDTVQNDILVQFALQVAQEKENLENIKQESEKIIAESEGLVNEILEKARGEAKSIISLAQEDAERILAEAAQEMQKRKEEGYQQGLKQAQQEIENDRQLAMEQGKQIVDEAYQTKLEIIQSAEKDIIRLVLAITRKVIAAELGTRPELIVSIVREAISSLDNPENIKVYVNPGDIELLTEKIYQSELAEIGSQETAINIKPDARISCGGCILESNSAIVDASIETRLENIENALKEVAVVG